MQNMLFNMLLKTPGKCRFRERIYLCSAKPTSKAN